MEFSVIEERLQKISGNHPEFYNSICKGKKSIGIRVPLLRQLAKEIAKEDYNLFLTSFPREYLEHDLLHAMVISYAKMDIDKRISYFERYIPTIDCWCTNDTLCQSFKAAKKEQEKVLKQYI